MITIKPLTHRYKYGFVVEGHAEYAENGQDIVCSAVSAISSTTMMALDRHANTENIVESGLMSVYVKEPNVYTDILIDAMLNGMRAVEKQYPQYVTIQEEEHDKRF